MLAATEGRYSRAGLLCALLVFLAGTSSFFYGTWSHDPREVVPFPSPYPSPRMRGFALNDQLFVVWAVGRNGRALLTKPLRFFDAEHCFPASRSLAFGEPVITSALLGLPAYLLSGSPILAYNFALFLSYLIAGFAMYLLVADWTGVPAAAIVAGLFYAFAPRRLTDPVHLYLFDTSWAVLAFFFARRLLACGHWRDAYGLAASIALQLGTSFYPSLASAALALPLSLALLAHYRLRKARAPQIVLAATVALGAAAFVFTPYLELRAAMALPKRTLQVFTPLSSYLPGGRLFPGWLCAVLLALGLLTPRRKTTRMSFDPRLPVVAGGVLCVLLAAGPHSTAAFQLPDLYKAASRFVPGLDTVRAPGMIAVGIHLAFSLLAGLGAAALVRPRRTQLSLLSGLCLVAATWLSVIRPPILGMKPAVRYSARPIKPDRDTLAFFAALERQGNRGPLLELPLQSIIRVGNRQRPRLAYYSEQAQQTFLTAYHHRRTSGCVSSYAPPLRKALHNLEPLLPNRRALATLRRLGFTTIVVHHRARYKPLLVKLLAEARRPRGILRLLLRSKKMTAFGLTEPG